MQIKITAITLSCIIVMCIALKCLMLSNVSFDMDELDSRIQHIKENILYNSKVGFDSNMSEAESYETFKSVKYVIAPQIFLYKKNLDTLVLFQSKEKVIKAFPGYRVISKSENREIIITLITKTK
jgi:uncharacterized membrane protein